MFIGKLKPSCGLHTLDQPPIQDQRLSLLALCRNLLHFVYLTKICLNLRKFLLANGRSISLSLGKDYALARYTQTLKIYSL